MRNVRFRGGMGGAMEIPVAGCGSMLCGSVVCDTIALGSMMIVVDVALVGGRSGCCGGGGGCKLLCCGDIKKVGLGSGMICCCC